MKITQTKKEVIKSSATLVAMVIGAGILGIPYVVAKVGLIIGLSLILFLGLIMWLVNILLGKIALNTFGNHQLAGYAEQHLGKNGKFFMFLSMIIGSYSAIMAYLIGVSNILSNLIGGEELFYGIVLISMTFVILNYGVKLFEELEFYFVLGMGIIVLLLPAFLNERINLVNLTSQLGFTGVSNLFLGYGTILFAYLGTQAIPIIKMEISDNKRLMKVITWGSLIPIVLYGFFTITILSVLKLSDFEMFKEKITTVVLENLVGGITPFILNSLALLTMISSLIAISFSLHQMYTKDYNIKKDNATFLTIFVPLILFSLYLTNGFTSFIKSLNIGGVFAGGLVGILIIMMTWVLEYKELKRKRKIIHKLRFILKNFLYLILAILFISAMFFDIFYAFF